MPISTKENLEKIGRIATGWSLYSIYSWIYDNPLWLGVIGFFGVWTGSIILSLGALLNNLIFLLVYQRLEVDWLGVNVFAELKEHGDKWAQKVQCHRQVLVRTILWIPALFFRLLSMAVKKNNALAFVVLSIFEDSFITTAFLRGKVGGELSSKDYGVFIASTAFGCAYWSLRNGVILAFIKGAWEVCKQLAR